MDISFRLLRADEIDVRVATINDKGVSLLLYKDARCDMNILDETVGSERWQRSHELINGNLFCNVAINVAEQGEYDKWVCKQDVGTESYTEKEKGQASDSFKRACVNWGIGRELYTAPFIWIPADSCKIEKRGEKLICRDRFIVRNIEYDDRRRISELEIAKEKGEVVFSYGRKAPKEQAKKAKDIDYATKLADMLKERGINGKTFAKEHKISRNTTQEEYKRLCEELIM